MKTMVMMSALCVMALFGSVVSMAQGPRGSDGTTKTIEQNLRTLAEGGSLISMSSSEAKLDGVLKWPDKTQEGPRRMVSFQIGTVEGKSTFVDVAIPETADKTAENQVAEAIKSAGNISVGGIQVQGCSAKPKCVKECTVNGVERCCRYECAP